ncbi:ZIP family metal transporter [Candidatus Parcubacteria bacterium]|nr:MAG: ZIP family metal transporter [Candidatus Parcubacteria bacterium]
MSTLEYIIIFTLIGSVLSLAGGIILLANEKLTLKISHLLISFAAGTLLGTAFLDLLPEALHESGKQAESQIFTWTLVGILLFFIIERFIHSTHRHDGIHARETKPTVPLIIVSDSLHNFIDGVVIAAAFLVNIPLGIVTAIAVGAHEIPQEISDFSIMLHSGVKRLKVIFYNLFSSLTALIGALLTFALKDSVENILPALLALTAGFFIYIAASDLIPEIHHEKRKGFALYETLLLLLGVVLVYILITLLRQ